MAESNTQSETYDKHAIHPAARSNKTSVNWPQTNSGSTLDTKYIDLAVHQLVKTQNGVQALEDLHTTFSGLNTSSRLYGFIPGAIASCALTTYYPRWMGRRPMGVGGSLATMGLSACIAMAAVYQREMPAKLNSPVLIQARHTLANTLHIIRSEQDANYKVVGQPSIDLYETAFFLKRVFDGRHELIRAHLDTQLQHTLQRCDTQRLMHGLCGAAVGILSMNFWIWYLKKPFSRGALLFNGACCALVGFFLNSEVLGGLCIDNSVKDYLAKRETGWVPDHVHAQHTPTVSELTNQHSSTDTLNKHHNEFVSVGRGFNEQYSHQEQQPMSLQDTTRSSNQDSAALEMSSGNYDQSQTSTTFV